MNAILALSAILLVGPAPQPPAPWSGNRSEAVVGPAVSEPSSQDRPGRAVWPLSPPDLEKGFDPPDAPWEAGHRGVDLRGLPGQQVHAALAGVVTFAGQIAGRGVVVVSHGATRSTYEPVLAWVETGAQVGTDQVLGVLAPGGGHCAPATCLHWGLRAGDEYLDPLSLLGARRVRLLPLLE